MSKRQRLLRTIERRWMDIFGEPPSIRTDPMLMLQLLENEERRIGRYSDPMLELEAA